MTHLVVKDKLWYWLWDVKGSAMILWPIKRELWHWHCCCDVKVSAIILWPIKGELQHWHCCCDVKESAMILWVIKGELWQWHCCCDVKGKLQHYPPPPKKRQIKSHSSYRLVNFTILCLSYNREAGLALNSWSDLIYTRLPENMLLEQCIITNRKHLKCFNWFKAQVRFTIWG